MRLQSLVIQLRPAVSEPFRNVLKFMCESSALIMSTVVSAS